jgi:CRP-like cAMP-binding protein
MPVRRWDHPPEQSFWDSLTEIEREAYARAADEQTFRPGAVLCREGTYASHVIVIESGWAAVSAELEGQIFTVRGPGDVVGERAALTQRSRSATVTALDEMVGMVVPAPRFHRLLMDHPPILAVLEKQERERLAEDDDHLRRGHTAGVEHRLAYLLSELTFRRGDQTPAGPSLSLPMSRSEMGRWIDAETAEISRVLNSWRRRGMISTARRMLTVVDARLLSEICQTRAGQPAWSTRNCSIFYTDVSEFGASARNESDRQVVKEKLYEIVKQAFEESGVSWVVCYHEDRGDGVLVVVPPEVPTRAVVDPLLALLAAALRKHNRRSSPAVQIRLRAALHVGPVARDEEGISGDVIIHTARMLDSPPLREALRTSGADLAFMASSHVFDTVLQHDPGVVDSETFSRVSFRNKESEITAWLHVAGPAKGVTATIPDPVAEPDSIEATPRVIQFHETVQVRDGDLVLGDKIVNHR